MKSSRDWLCFSLILDKLIQNAVTLSQGRNKQGKPIFQATLTATHFFAGVSSISGQGQPHQKGCHLETERRMSDWSSASVHLEMPCPVQ